MSSITLAPQLQGESLAAAIQQQVAIIVDDLIAQLPNPSQLTTGQARGIVARYTAVLEGNFIYWMTAACLAAKAAEVRPILEENLFEEVRDVHPVMLRRFAIAAHAFPTDVDALAVDTDLNNVRLFLGKLQGVQSVLTMAFFRVLDSAIHGLPGRSGRCAWLVMSVCTQTFTACATSRIRRSSSARCNWR
jgi:hypothetical protein